MKRTVKLLGLLLVVAMVISSMVIFVACDNGQNDTKEYTVTFYDGESVLKTENVKEGEKVESWTPSKDGYTFEGWYATPNFSHKFDFDSAISENKSVFAQWSSAQQSADTRDFYILGSGSSKILAASDWGKVFDETTKMTKAADKNEYTYTVDLKKGDEFQFAINSSWAEQRGYGYLKETTFEDGTIAFSASGGIGETPVYKKNIKCEVAGNYTFTLTTHPDDDADETSDINTLDTITWVRNGDVIDGGEEEVVIEAFAIKGSKVTSWADSTDEEYLLKKNAEGKYVLTIQLYANDEFMFVAYKDVDGTLTALPIYIKSDMIADGSASEVGALAGGNFKTSADGTYTFTYDHETTKVSIAYSSEFSLGAEERPTTWYILGNGETDGSVLKTSAWGLNDETAQGLASKGDGVYEITLDLYAGDKFKICSSGSWANAHAFESIVEPGDNFTNAGNINVAVAGNYTLTLTIDAEDETKDTIKWVRNGDATKVEDEKEAVDAFAIKGSKVTNWADSTEEEHLLKKNTEGKYVLTIQLYANDEFMFVAYKDVDGTLTALPIYIKSDMIADGSASEVGAKVGGNFTTSANGTYTFTYDYQAGSISIAYSSEFSLVIAARPTTWYMLGNGSTEGSVLKTSSWKLNDEAVQGLASKGNGVYEITLNLYAGDQFKICSDGSWANAHAFESIVEPGENFISNGNVEVVVEGNYTLTLTIDAEDETKDSIAWVRNGDCE